MVQAMSARDSRQLPEVRVVSESKAVRVEFWLDAGVSQVLAAG
jgi:hypothetical protein